MNRLNTKYGAWLCLLKQNETLTTLNGRVNILGHFVLRCLLKAYGNNTISNENMTNMVSTAKIPQLVQ